MYFPFCPNPQCPTHSTGSWTQDSYYLFGTYETQSAGLITRYRCKTCGRSFSWRTFHLSYYTKRMVDFSDIFVRFAQRQSLSGIARSLGLQPKLVQNRLERLGRNSVALHCTLEATRPLQEDLCADGFESFDYSQYFPNNINILVGTKSQHLYSFSHGSMRRKGRMTADQKLKRIFLDQCWPRRKHAMRDAFQRAIQVITQKWDRTKFPYLILRTDEHPAYPKAIARAGLRREDGFVHHRTPSVLPRTVSNPLFPVNYMDRELRKDIAAYARETLCHTRNVANGLLRLAVYMAWHNYWKPFRISWGRQREVAPHGVESGIDPLSMEKKKRSFFSQRYFLMKTELEGWASDVWFKRKLTPLKRSSEYLPAFVYV